MINRREFLGISAGAGATLAITPELLRALQTLQPSGGTLIQRAIPSTGEMLPVIGLQFGNDLPPDHAGLEEVLKTLVNNGGRFLDTVHQTAPGAEQATAAIVNELAASAACQTRPCGSGWWTWSTHGRARDDPNQYY